VRAISGFFLAFLSFCEADVVRLLKEPTRSSLELDTRAAQAYVDVIRSEISLFVSL